MEDTNWISFWWTYFVSKWVKYFQFAKENRSSIIYIIGNRHHYVGWNISELFQGIIFKDVICKNCFSVSSETIKAKFTVWQNFKEPPPFFKIILKKVTCDMKDGQPINNECKIAIPSEFLINIPSSNQKISYTLVSLIMHDGDSF